MRIGSLFTGYGGLDLAVEQVTGGRTVWTSDIDPGACRIIAHRFPGVPNLGDISAVDWSTVEPVDVITGGFPCQDVSHAGKRAGMHDQTRTGLWGVMAEAIDRLRPGLVVAENVRGLLSAEAASDVEPCPWCLGDGTGEPALRALGAVLADLADIGYDAQWTGLRAASIGAPHGRFRVFVAAWPAGYPYRPAGASGERHGGGEDGRGVGRVDGEDESRPCERQRARAVAGDRSGTSAPDAGDAGSHREADHVRRGQPDLAGGRGGLESGGRGPSSASGAWGIYAPAISRWEQVLGRPAPVPLRPDGKHGAHRLSPAFVEWMMGLPAGWVTDVPGLSRNEQLKALGNGVVPQQAAAALRHLLSDTATEAVA